ncbi:MAG: hypothetical protein WBQ89_24475 [Candidatus Acidiferrum sp.]
MPSLRWYLGFFFLCATMLACGKSESYRLVSEKYNFSVEFPEAPTEVNKVNDEGLPKNRWELNHEKIVAKDYYTAEATSYKEILNPDDELVPNPGLLALNGVKMLENHRFKLRAPATGREVDAIATTSKELSTGSTISSIYVVDGHNMVSVSARINDNPGKAALFLNSLTILR